MERWKSNLMVLVLFIPNVLLKAFVITKIYVMFALNEVFKVDITMAHWIGISFVLGLLYSKKNTSETPAEDMIASCIAFLMTWGFSALIKLIIG
jgi:hypothetical protein